MLKKVLIIAMLASTQNVEAYSSLDCLSAIGYWESGNQGKAGIMDVMHVALNRTEKFNQPVCHVLLQKNQFSFMNARHGRVPPAPPDIRDMALQMLKQQEDGHRKDTTNGALYFFHKRIRNKLTKKLKLCHSRGAHNFFKE